MVGTMNMQKLCEEIVRGVISDADVALIENALRGRRQVKSITAAALLSRGDRVRFVGSISPKYLAGVEATVDGVLRTKVTVSLDKPMGRFYKSLRCPLSLVEKV
jgi:hypothetical protein